MTAFLEGLNDTLDKAIKYIQTDMDRGISVDQKMKLSNEINLAMDKLNKIVNLINIAPDEPVHVDEEVVGGRRNIRRKTRKTRKLRKHRR